MQSIFYSSVVWRERQIKGNFLYGSFFSAKCRNDREGVCSLPKKTKRLTKSTLSYHKVLEKHRHAHKVVDRYSFSQPSRNYANLKRMRTIPFVANTLVHMNSCLISVLSIGIIVFARGKQNIFCGTI